ncbi:MAG: carboxypeptidase-like regulatory domain-containing protein [Planctomycetota bacterium]
MRMGLFVVVVSAAAAVVLLWLRQDRGVPAAPPESSAVDTTPSTDLLPAGPHLAGRGAPAPPDPYTSFAMDIQVESPDGRPLPGARVEVTPAPRDMLPTWFASEPSRGGTTGADGIVHDLSMPWPTSLVRVHARGFPPYVGQHRAHARDATRTPALIRLERVRTALTVHVRRPDGSPAESARIEAYDLGQGWPPRPSLIAETTREGACTLALGTRSSLRLDVLAAGYQRWTMDLSASQLAASSSLYVNLAPGKHFVARLVAQPPERIPSDLRLEVLDGVHPSRAGLSWIAEGPDDMGRFEGWTHERPTLPLRVWSPTRGLHASYTLPLDGPDEEPEIDLTAALAAWKPADVLIHDPDGRPVTGGRALATVTLTVARESVQVAGDVDADGHARLWMPSGTLKPTNVSLIADGAFHVLRPDEHEEAAWHMAPSGSLEGLVTEADGRVPEQAFVALQRVDAGTDRSVQPLDNTDGCAPCDAQGRFVIHGLVPGAYELRAANTPGSGSFSGGSPTLIDVVAGGTTSAPTLALPPRTVVRGVVVCEAGSVAGLRVNVHSCDDERPRLYADTRTEDDGSFHVELARLALVQVTVWDSRTSQQHVIDLATAPSPVRVELLPARLVNVRFEGRIPPDGTPAQFCMCPVGGPRCYASRTSVIDHGVRVVLPSTLSLTDAYEVWIECGDYLGDITPLPTDLSEPGPFDVRMRVRLPEDDED